MPPSPRESASASSGGPGSTSGAREQVARVGDYFTAAVGDVPVVVVRNDDGAERLRQRLPASPPRGRERIGQPQGAAVPVSRVDVRPRRLPARGAALRPRARIRSREPPRSCPSGRHVGPVRLREPRCRRPASAATSSASCPRIIAGSGLRPRPPALPRARGVDGGGELEGPDRELPRVLPLPRSSIPASARSSTSPRTSYGLRAHEWFSSQVAPGARAQRSRVGDERPAYDVRGAVTQAQYHFLWPNLTISINPGHPNLSLDVWMPDGPDRTRGFSEHYFGPDVPERARRGHHRIQSPGRPRGRRA